VLVETERSPNGEKHFGFLGADAMAFDDAKLTKNVNVPNPVCKKRQFFTL